MKVQYLAVVFIIIMLPISLVYSEYISSQLETVSLQISYDNKLENSTYDAIKAFQINTINNSTSDLADSKIRDVEASVNAFFKSLGTAFNMVGYDSDQLSEYVPALVYTLYDGLYIYSPFENILDEETVNKLQNSTFPTDGSTIKGLKSYITYSCRYKKGTIDVVITYSLDNYITVQGTSGGHGINLAGYLINVDSANSTRATYRGIQIEKEPTLKQTLYRKDIKYDYIKINGTRYYKEDGAENNAENWFTISNNHLEYNQGPFKDNDTNGNEMAYLYYKEAYDFRQDLETYGITSLTPSDAVDENGDPMLEAVITNTDGEVIYSFMEGPNSNESIFDYNEPGTSIEEPNSKFNEHRLAVIRYVIESNLATALANYNNYGGGAYEFSLPKLSEEDWGTILNNVSVISFLQGLSIGGKIYNGYSVINNNKNEEVVTENSIYIIDDPDDPNGQFHRISHNNLETLLSPNAIGMFNIEFERRSVEENAAGRRYYYPNRQIGCYDCYVLQTGSGIQNADNIYEYLDHHSDLAKIYYTALGRERYSMYKVFRNPQQHNAQFIQP